MRLPIRTALLAVAALAAVGVAVLRSVDAASHVSFASVADEPLEYGATAAQQAATLARLHAPPGFARIPCHPDASPSTTCFHSARALALDDARFEATVLAIGARPESQGLPPICGPPPGAAINRARGWRFRNCQGGAVVGREQIGVLIHSLKVGPPPRSRRLRKISSFERVFGPGSEIEAVAFGHRLPPGITERILVEGCVRRAC